MASQVADQLRTRRLPLAGTRFGASVSIAGRPLWVLILLLAVLANPAFLTVDALASESGGKTTWSVSPASEDGRDERHWIEAEVEPGQEIQEHVAIANYSNFAVTFRLNSADGYFTDKGRFNMLNADQESVDAGTWITIQDSVTVPAQETVIVPFLIAIPADATPGDHPAGVAASISSSPAGGEGTGLGVESRTGFRVILRVKGELNPQLEVVDVSTKYRTSWNPFQPGSATQTVVLRNAGNVTLKLAGDITIGAKTFSLLPDGQNSTEMFAGDKRKFEVRIPEVWPTFRVGAELEVAPEVVIPPGAEPVAPPEIKKVDASFWAIPWSQLIAILAVGLIVGGLVSNKRTRTREIERARHEGFQEAQKRLAPSVEGVQEK